jgi:hypothetical protein
MKFLWNLFISFLNFFIRIFEAIAHMTTCFCCGPCGNLCLCGCKKCACGSTTAALPKVQTKVVN